MDKKRSCCRFRIVSFTARLTAGMLLSAFMGGFLFAQEDQPGEVQAQGKVATGEESQNAPEDIQPPQPVKKKTPKQVKSKAKLKKKKKAGYDYENSRYLSQTNETNMYRFDESGKPILPNAEKKKKAKGGGKKAVAEQEDAGSGISLGSHQPKKLLKRISLEGDAPDRNHAKDEGQQQPWTAPQGGSEMNSTDNPGSNNDAP